MNDDQLILYEIKKNFLYPIFPLIAAVLVLLLTIVQIEDVLIYRDNDNTSGMYYFGLSYLSFLLAGFIFLIWLTVKLTLPLYNLRLTDKGISLNLRLQGRSKLRFNEVISMTHRYSLLNLKLKNIAIPLDEIREIYSVRNKLAQAEIYLYGFFIIIRTDGTWILYNVKNSKDFQGMHQKFVLAFGDRWQYVFKGSY